MVWAVLNQQVMDAVSEFADSPSDRVCAIVGAAMVDEHLLRALEYRLRPSKVRDQFFSPNRASGSFFAKTQLAYLLGACDKPALQALQGIANIRNQFAHRLAMKSFDDASLQADLKTLTLHTVYKRYPDPFHDGDTSMEVEAASTNRDRFIINIRLLLVLLLRDLRLHLPNSNQFQPLPKLAGPAPGTA